MKNILNLQSYSALSVSISKKAANLKSLMSRGNSKKITILVLVVSAVVLARCYVETDGVSQVDITKPQLVQNSLRIPQSQRVRGELPQPCDGYSGLQSILSIAVTAGNTVFLPILYTLPSGIQKVFLQVDGAEGYIEAPIITCSATSTSENYGYISIGIPKNIDDGSFKIQYLVQEGLDCYSNLVATIINVNNDIKTCSNARASGNDGLTFTTVELGKVSGEVNIFYDTYTVPDRIDIYQGNEWITGFGENPHCPIPPLCYCRDATPEDGFYGKSGNFVFNFNALKGSTITVVVSGCLAGGTAWEWNLVKAPNCP